MCKRHGWHSDRCPECLYYHSRTEEPAKEAMRLACCIIDARPSQRRLLAVIAQNGGVSEALGMARAWQNPLPLPVVICNF